MKSLENIDVANPNGHLAPEITLSGKEMGESFQSKTGKQPANQFSDSSGTKDTHLEFPPIKGYDPHVHTQEAKPGPGNAHGPKGADSSLKK